MNQLEGFSSSIKRTEGRKEERNTGKGGGPGREVIEVLGLPEPLLLRCPLIPPSGWRTPERRHLRGPTQSLIQINTGPISTRRLLVWPVRVDIRSTKSQACILGYLTFLSSENSQCCLDPSSSPEPCVSLWKARGTVQKETSSHISNPETGFQGSNCFSWTC